MDDEIVVFTNMLFFFWHNIARETNSFKDKSN